MFTLNKTSFLMILTLAGSPSAFALRGGSHNSGELPERELTSESIFCRDQLTCNDCIVNNCAWAAGECGDSCSDVADMSCFSLELFPDTSSTLMCELAVADESDWDACSSQVECKGCTETQIPNRPGNCFWHQDVRACKPFISDHVSLGTNKCFERVGGVQPFANQVDTVSKLSAGGATKAVSITPTNNIYKIGLSWDVSAASPDTKREPTRAEYNKFVTASQAFISDRFKDQYNSNPSTPTVKSATASLVSATYDADFGSNNIVIDYDILFDLKEGQSLPPMWVWVGFVTTPSAAKDFRNNYLAKTDGLFQKVGIMVYEAVMPSNYNQVGKKVAQNNLATKSVMSSSDVMASPNKAVSITSGEKIADFAVTIDFAFFQGKGQEPDGKVLGGLTQATRMFFMDAYRADTNVKSTFVGVKMSNINTQYKQNQPDAFTMGFTLTVRLTPSSKVTAQQLVALFGDQTSLANYMKNYAQPNLRNINSLKWNAQGVIVSPNVASKSVMSSTSNVAAKSLTGGTTDTAKNVATSSTGGYQNVAMGVTMDFSFFQGKGNQPNATVIHKLEQATEAFFHIRFYKNNPEVRTPFAGVTMTDVKTQYMQNKPDAFTMQFTLTVRLESASAITRQQLMAPFADKSNVEEYIKNYATPVFRKIPIQSLQWAVESK